MDAQARLEKVLEQYKKGLLTTQETRDETTGILAVHFVSQIEPQAEPEFTSRDLISIWQSLAEFRKEYETREGFDMSKLEIYRVHKVVHDTMKARKIQTLPLRVYTHPLEVQA